MAVRLIGLILFLMLPQCQPVGAQPVRHVIVISVDGLASGLLHELMANDSASHFANFQRFVDHGATTFNARTDHAFTLTLPNHATMITGRPAALPDQQPNTIEHGYTANVDPLAGATLHNAGNPNLTYVASVFDVVHDHGLSTALYASKNKFSLFVKSYDTANGAVDRIGLPNGRDKIDSSLTSISGSHVNAADLMAAYLASLAKHRFNFTLLHFRDTDAVGHLSGWESDHWTDAVKAVDGYLGHLFDLVQNTPALAGHTVIILTADHGGTDLSHREPWIPEHYTIPFFVWGTDVQKGADLYRLNGHSRKDPARKRPDHQAKHQPIRNGDAANLALDLLGLGPIPGSTINAKQDLKVQEQMP